jgi:hypothetical protein
MKTKLFAAALAAALTFGALPAAADHNDRGRGDGWRDGHRGRAEITIRNDGRSFTVGRGDRMFYRLLDRPYHFRPGLTYAYTDRCNRNGCVVFVFDGRSRRPIDRIFAPHLRSHGYAYREARDFDRGYNRFGRYERDDRGWNNDDDRRYRDGRGRDDNDWNDDRRDDRRDGDYRDGDYRRDGDRRLEGGPR